jgi:hypothetical protein
VSKQIYHEENTIQLEGGREPEFYEQMGWIFNELMDGLNNKMI